MGRRRKTLTTERPLIGRSIEDEHQDVRERVCALGDADTELAVSCRTYGALALDRFEEMQRLRPQLESHIEGFYSSNSMSSRARSTSLQLIFETRSTSFDNEAGLASGHHAIAALLAKGPM